MEVGMSEPAKYTLTLHPKADVDNGPGAYTLTEIPDHKLTEAINTAFGFGPGVDRVEVRQRSSPPTSV